MSVGIMSCRAGLKSVMVCVKVEFYLRSLPVLCILEGARASMGLCVDVSSGVMI